MYIATTQHIVNRLKEIKAMLIDATRALTTIEDDIMISSLWCSCMAVYVLKMSTSSITSVVSSMWQLLSM